MAESRTVLLTGASSGIGLATAQQLLALGFSVCGISRRGVVAEIDDANFSALQLDLGDPEALQREMKRLLAEREIDCLVHAAGQGHFGSVEQFSPAQIESSLRVNLLSAMLLSRSLPDFVCSFCVIFG